MKQKFDIREKNFRTINIGRTFKQSILTSFILLSAVLMILTGSPLRVSGAGDHLDTSFAGSGKLKTDFNGLHDYGNAVAIQADGKIVVGGNGGNNEVLIARYNPNGTLDTTFNGTGKVSVLGGGGGYNIYAVVIQADGKIVVGGDRLNPVTLSRSMFLAGFDAVGRNIWSLTYSPGGQNDNSSIRDLALQADGKIVAVGSFATTSPVTSDWITVRYHASGLGLDTSFGDGGRIFTDFGGDTDEIAQSVSVLPNGRILVAGIGKPGNNEDFALAQYTASGATVISFGTGGKVTTHFNGNDGINDVKVQSDGKIVVAGYAGIQNQFGRNFALARYNTNGTLDTTFDGDGKVVTNLNQNGHDSANGLALQSDGKIIAVGDNDNVDFSLVRYNPNGSLDAGFGQSGILFTDVNGGADTANAVAIQTDGRIIVAGTSLGSTTGSTRDFAVVRYLPDLAKTPFDFDGDSKTDISIFRPSNGQWWLNRSSDNQTFATQFGQSSDIIVPADYTGDGKTDIALFRPSDGNWYILRSEDSSFYAFPFGTNGDIPAPADFDGDGKTDVAVFRPSTATWFIQRSTGGTTIQSFGISEDKPVPADFDGDGKADIAIFRPTVSEWWILRSTAGLTALQFGASGDKTVLGDYTGDGKADVAFWRPSTGQWFILRSENTSFYAFPFGSVGDIPAPGDYDGDGKFDAGIFRPTTNTWFIQRSTDNGVTIQGFGQSGDRPIPNAFVKP